MKLIDLMVQEGIEWPRLAAVAVQDDDGKIKFAVDDNVSLSCGLWHRVGSTESAGGSVNLTELASDWSAAIITREQYKSAQAKAGFGEQEKQLVSTIEEFSPTAALDAEIESTLDAADGTFDMSTITVINEHLRELYTMKREWLRGEWADPYDVGQDELSDTVTIGADEYTELLRCKVDSEPELTITDWRELQVGDVIKVGSEPFGVTVGSLHHILGSAAHILTNGSYIPTVSDLEFAEWQFISRPN